MFESYLFLLDEVNLGTNALRWFFASICSLIYEWIGSLYDIIIGLASGDFLHMESFIEDISEKIFFVLVIYMVFKLTIALLNYIVSPDSFSDSKVGGASLIRRIIISLILLVSINPLFNLLYNVQSELLQEGIIESLILGSMSDSTSKGEDGNIYYLTEMSQICSEMEEEDNTTYRVLTSSNGDHLALLVLRPFVQPTSSNKEKLREIYYCGTSIKYGDDSSTFKFNFDEDDNKEMSTFDAVLAGFSAAFDLGLDIAGTGVDVTTLPMVMNSFATSTVDFLFEDSIKQYALGGALRYLNYNMYNAVTGNEINFLNFGEDEYVISFHGFWATLVGGIVFLLMISFAFDVVVRAFTLLVLQIIAPVPIINYVSPLAKGNEMLSAWGKKVFSTWASLFIRIASITFAVAIIGEIVESDALKSSSFLTQIIIIIGTLIFAKQLPKLLEELFPGLKLGSGGFNLNPLKRVKEETLGGKQILGGATIAGTTALSTIGAVGANFANNYKNRGKLTAEDKKIGNRLKRGINAVGGGLLYGSYSGLRTGYGSAKKGDYNILKQSINATQKASEDRNINKALIEQGVVNKGPFAQARFMFKDKVTDVIGFQGNAGTTDEMKAHIKALNAEKTVAQDHYTQANETLSKIQSVVSSKFREAQQNFGMLKSDYQRDAHGIAVRDNDGKFNWNDLDEFADFKGNHQSFWNSMSSSEQVRFENEYNRYKYALEQYQQSYNDVLAISTKEEKLVKQKEKFDAAKKGASNK